MSPKKSARALLLSVALLVPMAPLQAQDPASPQSAPAQSGPAQLVSPEAQAVVDRMASYLRGLQSFSIESESSRDEIVALGFKLQNNERATLIMQRPNKLRADVSGDIRNRTFVYDGAELSIYSPDDEAFTRIAVPNNLDTLIGGMLDAGIEMPMIDVLYEAFNGTLTEGVRGGVLVGDSTVDGVACDHLAFRQADVDWQLWVEKGDKPLPRKIVITTRYDVGDPQFQVVMRWNLKPAIDASTFVFTPPKGSNEVPFDDPTAFDVSAQ